MTDVKIIGNTGRLVISANGQEYKMIISPYTMVNAADTYMYPILQEEEVTFFTNTLL